MALRSNEECPSPRVELLLARGRKSTSYDREQWLQLFEVAVLARHSISVTELTKAANEQQPRVQALMGNMEEAPAVRKVTSLLYISLAEKC